MDSVVGNKYLDIFSGLNIEVSKKLEGEYDVEEIISTFNNFFFNKMFLDITAIKNYKDMSNLQKLSMNLDMEKVILLLDKDDPISKSDQFLAKLVSMGIYNFTDDANNLMYLYNNPNSYRDVAYLHNVNENNVNNTGVGSNASTDNNTMTPSISQNTPKRIILGVKNVTDSAGASTLVYLLKKVLSDYYSVMAIELNKRDLSYFNDKDMISIKEEEIDGIFNKYNDINFFLVDLDRTKKDHVCDEVLYLVEPSTIKLNKLMLINPRAFAELKGKKVILNKSLLNDNDIANFEVEANVKVYYSIEPLNDKEDVKSKLLPLLEKLGYVKLVEENSSDDGDSDKKKSIFSIFKGNN